jgi:XTP/dITP diphosphohydrolase
MNVNKFHEAKSALSDMKIKVIMLKKRKIEIQSDKIEEVVKRSALWITERDARPIIVEDAGFFIHALGGFPGPYSSYVYRKIGLAGILELLDLSTNRGAEFRSAVAFCDCGDLIRMFTGSVNGTVTHEKRGTGGFGFDPIFIPRGEKRTFAEMSIEEKNHISHRAKALEKFAKWYLRDSDLTDQTT